MAGLPLSSMSSSSSLVVVLPAASDTTRVSHEPSVPATVPQPYCRALLALWHLLRVEQSKASSPKSTLDTLRGCHPTVQLCASAATPLFKGGGVKLPAASWSSCPFLQGREWCQRTGSHQRPVGELCRRRDGEQKAKSRDALGKDHPRPVQGHEHTGLSRARWPGRHCCSRWAV